MKLLTSIVSLFLVLFALLAVSVLNAASIQKKNVKDAPPGSFVWKSKISHGSIYSSPTSTYNTVYVGSNENEFYSINGDNGRIIWTFDTQGPVKSAATICYACGKSEGRIYFGSNDGVLRILGLDEGYLKGEFRANGTIYSRPFIHEYSGVNTVFIGSFDSNIYALFDDGVLKWKFTTGGPVTASIEVFNNVVVVGSFDGHVYGLEPNTGKLLWKTNVNGRVATACLWSQPNVFCGTLEGAVVALDTTTGAVVWSIQMPSAGNQEMSQTVFHKILAEEQQKQAATTTMPPPAVTGITGRMALDGTVLYIGSGNYLYAVSTATGQISYKYNAYYNVGDGVEYLSGRLYFGAGKSMICLFTNGTEMWKYKTEGRVTTRPLVEDLMFFGDDQGYLYALNVW